MKGEDRNAFSMAGVVVLTLVACTCLADETATTEPPIAGRAATADSALREILLHGGPKLSMDSDSAATRFQFTLRVTLPLRAGGTCATEYVVARNAGRAAVLVRAADGRICAYMAANLCVAADPKQPGSLLVGSVGQPAFRFAANASHDRADLGVGFNRTATAPAILLDVGSLLAPAVAEARGTYFEGGENRTVVIRAQHSTVRITLNPEHDHGSFPLESYTIVTDDAQATSLAVKDFRLGVPDAMLFAVSKADLGTLGLPIHDLTEAEGRKVGLLAVPDYGEGPEREAVRKLGSLFAKTSQKSKSDPPASAGEESSKQSTGGTPEKG